LRVHAAEVGRLQDGTKVELIGWLRSRRVHGKLLFLDLRDSTGVVQVTVRVSSLPEQGFAKAA